jgi:hypothetical protein
VFGVYRPGGSALNSTQVSSLRAAQFIAANYTGGPMDIEAFTKVVKQQFAKKFSLANSLVANQGAASNLAERREAAQQRMTACGAHIRSLDRIEQSIHECLNEIKSFAQETRIASRQDIPQAFRDRDILLTQYVYLCAIREFILKGGGSRGSYLVQDQNGTLPLASLPEDFRFSLDDGKLLESVCEVAFDTAQMECRCEWKPVRPIPSDDDWFENVWKEYREGNVMK